jgi:hypothetical protein
MKDDPIDQRGRLDEAVFAYEVSKEGKVFIFWQGKQVKIVRGDEAARLLARLEAAGSEKDVQLALAKITGNFKRGNER